jgi:hypothetical protein
MEAVKTDDKPQRPFWLSVLRWFVWLVMLTLVLAFASRTGGGAFIYQNF